MVTSRVAPLQDLPVGTCRRHSDNGRTVMVTVVDGTPYAVDDACLHKAGSLSGGVMRGATVTCPLHWWRYDVRDGRLQGGTTALGTYDCRVTDDGWVVVDLPPAPPSLSLRETLLAHARGDG